MKNSTSSTLRLGAAGLCLALFGGCILDGTTSKSGGKNWVGLPQDSIRSAGTLMMFGGNLFVANRDSASPGVAVIDTATGKISAYYSEQLPPMNMVLTQDSNLIIMETNYRQGAVSVLNLSTKSFQKSLASFGSDNFADTADGKVFLFDHATGVVTGFTGHVPNQNVTFNVQAGSNPYDIAISNNRAFIPRYNSKSLLVLDATQLGGGIRDSIDLSAYVSHVPSDTAASTPNMAWVTAYNGYVFVALQRLDYTGYQARDTSLIVVINASTRQVTSTIPLHFKNPIAAHVVNGMWYVAGISNYDQSGGVEKIDLSGKSNLGSIVTAQNLNGDVFDFVSTGAHSGYAAYSTDYGHTTRLKKVSY